MPEYAGFDVSHKLTTICVVDAEAAILRRDAAPSDPEALAKWLARHCPGMARVVLETGPLSSLLSEECDKATAYAALHKAGCFGHLTGAAGRHGSIPA